MAQADDTVDVTPILDALEKIQRELHQQEPPRAQIASSIGNVIKMITPLCLRARKVSEPPKY